MFLQRSGLLLFVCSMLFLTQAMAQTVVTGKVTDTAGLPLSGASVQVVNSDRGVTTDQDGFYSVVLPSDKSKLLFAFVGYGSQEAEVNGRSTINVQLSFTQSKLDEVVVIGYGTRKKSDLTGAVSTVNNEALENRNISSLEQGLQGQAAGVQVTQAGGQPGGGNIVRIRGQNSIMGGNDPLYVIDGVPVQSGNDGGTSILATINPADIESMDILKDASAIAIYGARGSNGVIMITTKRGKAGRQSVTFNSSLGVSNVIKKIDMLDSKQFVELANERATNDGVPLPFPDVNAVAGVNTNWQDEVFRTALTNDHAISVAGGTGKTRYFVSGNFFDQEGAIVGSKFTRGSFRLNLDQEVNSRLSFSTQIAATRSQAQRSESEQVLRSALAMPPINTPYDDEGNYTTGDVLRGYPFSDSGGDNPLILANEKLNRLKNSRLLANMRARYKIWSDMTVEIMAGTDQVNGTQDQYQTRFVRGIADGTGAQRKSDTRSYIIENLYQYNKSLANGRHKINATAGFTWETQTYSTLSASSAGFVTDEFSNNNLGAGERFNPPSNDLIEWDLLSFLGRVNYTLDDKYLFTVSGRRDGSSRLGAGNKWGFFPSAAFAWKIINEDFMQNSNHLSDLKFRLSWGRSGNQAISPYQSLQRYLPQPLIIGSANTIGFAPGNLGNPNLKWETTDQLDVGLDFGFLNNRLLVSLDYYNKKTNDLLAVVNLPPSSGFQTILQNIGSLQNQGVELTVGFDVVRNTNFSWNLSVNGASNKNEVTALSKGADIFAPNISYMGGAHILRVGEQMSSFYGYIEDGLTPEGLINYVDQNKDGLINVEDRIIIGDPYADFVYGINSRMSYRNFQLSIFIQGEQGKQLYNLNQYYAATSFFRGDNNITAVMDRWTPANPDQNAPYPKATSTLNINASDRFVENASYIRLRNIQFAYTIPVKNRHIQSARLFVSGQNLVTLTDYSWYDPDVSTFESGDLRLGVDEGTFPISKTVTFGVEITL